MTNTLLTPDLWGANLKRALELEVHRIYPRMNAEREAKRAFSQLHGVDMRDVFVEWTSDTSVYARDMTETEKRERDFQQDRWVAENDQSPCCSCHCHEDDE